MIRERKCVDCGHRWPQPIGPWIDVLVCPACGSDETEGVRTTQADELAQITGETPGSWEVGS